MKKLIKLFSVLLAILVVSSCGDDEGPGNKIKADGESLKFSEAYLINDEHTDPDDNEGYEHTIYLTGGGLTINMDEEEFEGSGNMANFVIFSPDEEIEEGTYTIDDTGEFGDAELFVMATDYNGGSSFDEAYLAVEGKLEVSRSGDKYTFKFDFHEFEMSDDGPGNYVEGEGSIKGSFTGKINVFPMETASKRTQKNPLIELFN